MSSISESNDCREESAVVEVAINDNTEYDITPTNSTDSQEKEDTGPKKMISDCAEFTTVFTRILVSVIFIIIAAMPFNVLSWWAYVIAMGLSAISINEERRAKVFAPFDSRWFAELGRRSYILTTVAMLLIPATMITGKYIEQPRVELYGWIAASVLVVFGQTVLAAQYFRTNLYSLFVAHLLSIVGTLVIIIPTCLVLRFISEFDDAVDTATDIATDILDSNVLSPVVASEMTTKFDLDDDIFDFTNDDDFWTIDDDSEGDLDLVSTISDGVDYLSDGVDTFFDYFKGSILVFLPVWKIFTLPGFCLYIIHGPLFVYAFLKAKKRCPPAPIEGEGGEV